MIKFFFFLLFAIFVCQMYGQEKSPTDLPDIISPSPTVSSLMKIEETNVDIYSGQPSINLPLFSEKIDNSTSLNIGLNYSSSNLKLTERSSWVGVSWSLSGEALISRTVRGFPDEFYLQHPWNNVSNIKRVGVLHNGFYDIDWDDFFVNNPQDPNVRATQANERWLWNASGYGSGNYLQSGQGAYDIDPDLYQINIFGITARFIIVKDINDQLEVRFLENDSNLNVTINYNTSTYEIYDFAVQNTNGSKFLLDKVEITTSQNISYSRTQKGTDNFNQSDDIKVATAWKVSEVTDLNENVLLNVNYSDVDESYTAGYTKTENYLTKIDDAGLIWVPGGSPGIFNNIFISNEAPGAIGYNNGVALPEKQASVTKYDVQTKKINNIVLSNGNTIYYSTQNGHTEYDTGGVLLDKIEIKNALNETLKSFKFTYQIENRVFLTGLKQYSRNLTNHQDYNLAYLNPELLPAASDSNLFNAPIDIWGYYKEEIGTSVTPIAHRLNEAESNNISVLTGSLQKIQYPTGGHKDFQFESNQISSLGYRDLTQTEFLQMNHNNTVNESVILVFDSCATVGNQPQAGPSIPFTIDFDQVVERKSILTCGNTSDDMFFNNLKFEIRNASNTLVKGGDFLTHDLFDLAPGNYTLNYFNNLNLGSSKQVRIELQLYYKSISTNFKNFVYGGGIRIKTIDSYISNNKNAQSTSYLYNENSDYFGVTDGYLNRYKEHSYTHRIEYYDSAGGEGNYTFYGFVPADLSYRIKEFNLNPHISLSKGNQVGYYKVFSRINDSSRRLINPNSTQIYGDLGWTQYEFTSAKNFPTETGSYFWPFFPKTDQSYRHGLLSKKTVFSASGDKVQEVINTYDFIANKILTVPFIYPALDCGKVVYYSTYDDYLVRSADGTKNSLYNTSYNFYGICGNSSSVTPSYLQSSFGEYLTKSLLKSTTTKDYYQISNSIQEMISNVSYDYNFDNYEVNQIKTTNSQGEEITSKIFYPMDSEVSTEPHMNLLLNNNRVTTPILQETYKNGSLTSRVKYQYDEFDPNQFLPVAISTQKTETDPMEPRLTYHDYDEYGNVLDVSKQDGTHVSYIWGYNKTLPIAKIEGRTYADVITALGISSPNETHMTAINNLRNTFSVTDPIMITTYEYEIGIGIKKVTDPRGRIMTYHYDEFNRLENVKDHHGNILSENEYKYATQN